MSTHSAPTRQRPSALRVLSDEPDRSQRVVWTYLVGVYLAINAIRDGYLLVEGPDCVHMKTQFVQGNHDWLSTLTSVSGYHRVANTALHPVQMARSREGSLTERLEQIAAYPSTSAVVLTSMPMAFITGSDYDRLCRGVAERTHKQVIHIPGKSLSGDWLDGYAEALLALARQIELPARERSAKKVGIVGYLFDRNERDHTANLAHLRSLLEGLGLETVSVWLEGQRFGELADIAEAGTILSFPYARRAAQAIAKRTGARVVECDLPFGLDATEAFLRTVARALEVEARVERVLDRELSWVVPPLEFVVPFVFQNRRIGFIGDPYMARGMKQIADTLGAELAFAVVTDPPKHVGKLAEELGDTRLLVWPAQVTLRRFLTDAVRELEVTLVVSNAAGVGMADAAWVELGFPSMYTHALYDRPFLGFRGFLALVDSMANAYRQLEVRRALGPESPPGAPSP